MIAVAYKLIRVFHVILTKGVSKDVGRHPHPEEQLKAA